MLYFYVVNLIIDQGNTRTKLAIFDEKKIVREAIFSKNEQAKTEKWLEKHHNEFQNVLISSVTDIELKISVSKIIRLDHTTDLPIFNKYKTPQTLGNDRLANAVGVWAKNPQKNSLVIDLGTCIKYDLVSADGAYLGGNISPGLEMRYKALNHYTDKLPLLKAGEIDFNYGVDTPTSLMEGVQHGIYHEINGFIERYSEEMGQLTIFMSGGDLKYFDKEYKSPIFADSTLTLFGLNEILKHNA